MRKFQDRPSPAPLTATALIGVGTLGALTMSVIANKIYALVLGPSGVGVAALFLATLSVGGLTASLGLGTSVVQAISAAISSEDHGLAVAIERVGRFLVFGAALACGVVTFGFRDEIAEAIFGTPSASPFVGFVAPALALTAMAYVETGILTGHHRVGAVTLTNVLTAGVGLVSGAIGVLTMGLAGLPPAMLLTTAVHYGFARMRAGATRAPRHREAGAPRAIAWGLIRLGLPAVASQLASIGIQLAVSVWVLLDVGAGSVGLYRAATTISLGYLTVFLSALTYDFLPRAARASVDDVGGSIDRLMRLVLGLGLPIVVGLFASGTWILQLLYTDAFIPALSVLQWYLVGDLLRIPAWGLSFALLARSRGGWFLALEGVVAAVMLISLPIGLQLAGLEGVGIGYAITQALYLASAWWVTSRLAVTTPGRLQGVVVLVALLAALSIVAGLPLWIRGAVFGSVAVAIAAIALPRLYRLHRAGAL